MIAIVKELKDLIKEKNITAEKASHYIDCSAKVVYRWIQDVCPPTERSIGKIKEGIRKIKEAFPEPKSVYELPLKARSLYRKIQRHHVLSREEKAKLQEINMDEGTEAYIKALEVLVEKYKPDVKQIQMFSTK